MPSFSLSNLTESDPIALYAAAALATVIAGVILWRRSHGGAMIAGAVATLALWGGATGWVLATLPPPAPVASESTVAELAAQVELLSAELRALSGRGVSALPAALSAATPERATPPLTGVVAGPEPAPPSETTRPPSATLAAPAEPEPARPPLIATPVLRRGDDPSDLPPDRSSVFAHVVVQGNSLGTIARLYLPSGREQTEFADQIAVLNGIDETAVVTLGRTIWIPLQ